MSLLSIKQLKKYNTAKDALFISNYTNGNSYLPIGSAGESIVSETNINLDYSGTKFIQAISHIIRKLDAYYYNFRSRASLTGSETETEKDNKIESVKKPLIFICTDIPQKRNNSSDDRISTPVEINNK